MEFELLESINKSGYRLLVIVLLIIVLWLDPTKSRPTSSF